MGQSGIKVVHAIPGRIRLKVGELVENPTLASEIQRRLSDVPGIRRVETNPLTGSVLLIFDAREMSADESLRTLSETFPRVFPALEVDGLQTALTVPGNGSNGSLAMDRRIVGFFGSVNAGVGWATHGIDLKVLVPLILFFLGVRGLVASDKVPFPTWYDFFWFALSTFAILNRAAIDTPEPSGSAVGLA